MKPFKQFVLPELMGFFSAAATNGLSLLLFVWGGPLITGSMRLPFGLSLSLMMTLSAFLLFAAILCGGKLSGDTKNLSEKLSFSYTSLFLLGAAVAAVLSMILALKTDIVGAETLVMVCYMIVCDMVLLLAFLLVVFILGKLLKVTGKEPAFLSAPKWRLPLFLLWSAIIYGCLLFF